MLFDTGYGMVGFKETSGKGEDWNVWSWKEMGSWSDKKESNKEWEKRAWNVSNNDGQGILELKLLMKA